MIELEQVHEAAVPTRRHVWFRHVDHTGSWRSVSAMALTGAMGSVALLIHDPNVAGSYGTCPFLLLTGFYCPGCGALRGTHDLLTGNVSGAVSNNLLLLPAIVWLGWWWVASVARLAGIPPSRFRSAPSSAGFSMVLLGVIAIFTVVRNLPGSPLAP